MTTEVDASHEVVTPGSVSRPPAALFQADQSPYSPDRDRETKRGQIAMTLIWLLVMLASAPFLLILFRAICLRATGGGEDPAVCTGFPAVDLMELLNAVLTPVVALVGAATGFYFGEKKN